MHGEPEDGRAVNHERREPQVIHPRTPSPRPDLPDRRLEERLEAATEESFADHHPYTTADAERLLALSEARNLVPVTTEKDLVRLSGNDPAIAKLAAKARAIPVALIFEDIAAVKKLLQRAAPRAPRDRN